MMPWFRLYPEILKDPKIRRFTTVQKWLWVTAMCEAAQSSERGKLFIADGIEYTDDDLAQASGIHPSEWDQSKGFIDLCVTLKMMERHADGGVTLLNFTSRQYQKPSDSPEKTRERKQKERAKKAEKKNDQTPESAGISTFSDDNNPSHENVTPMSRDVTPGHAIDTDTDSDTDSYTETEEEELLPPLHSSNQKHEPMVVVVGGRDLHVYKSVIDQYKHYFVYEPNKTIRELLHSYLDDEVQMDMLAWVMRYAAEKGKAWDYAKGTLENMFVQGVRTADQAEQANQQFLQQMSQKVVPIRDGGKQREDKLPASVQWQMEHQKAGSFENQKKWTVADDPELSARLAALRRRDNTGTQ